MSMALGALKNRMVMPDYSVVPWISPGGKPMQIAASAPNIPWTDLAYSLAPNGSTLDYVADAPYRGPARGREAVVRHRSVRLGPGGTRLLRGARHGPDRRPDLVAVASRDGRALRGRRPGDRRRADPAPLLVLHRPFDPARANADVERLHRRPLPGRRDDPVLQPDEDAVPRLGPGAVLRRLRPSCAVRTRTTSPTRWRLATTRGSPTTSRVRVPSRSRGSRRSPKPARRRRRRAARTRPRAGRRSPRARSASSRSKKQTIAADSTTNGAFDPISGGGACATTPAADTPGAAVYELKAAPNGGYTMMGSATVIAKFTLAGETSQVAARLLDVAPDGTEMLVDRGLWRPANGGPTKQVFQLHPNGWTFACRARAKARADRLRLRLGPALDLRSAVRRPAAGRGLRSRAADPGGREAGSARRTGRCAGAEVRAEGL